MRPGKCEAEAKARYHKSEVEAKAKKIWGRGQTVRRGQRCRINYKLLIWIQLKKYCYSSCDSVKW